MRRTLRQLAAAKPSRFLEPNTPTGLTGLLTHPAPRSTLMYVYSSTLDKLKEFPETSLYRQSTEATTKHRLAIVEAIKPEGHKLWLDRAKMMQEEHPEVFNTAPGEVAHEDGKHVRVVKDGRAFVVSKIEKEVDDQLEEWDGEEYNGGEVEGIRTTEERRGQAVIGLKRPGSDQKTVKWVPEPPLTKDQIIEIENKIGAGLIEEVIQVAEGELKLVDKMLQAKIWEDLEEKPVEGQWTYFNRDSAAPHESMPQSK